MNSNKDFDDNLIDLDENSKNTDNLTINGDVKINVDVNSNDGDGVDLHIDDVSEEVKSEDNRVDNNYLNRVHDNNSNMEIPNHKNDYKPEYGRRNSNNGGIGSGLDNNKIDPTKAKNLDNNKKGFNDPMRDSKEADNLAKLATADQMNKGIKQGGGLKDAGQNLNNAYNNLKNAPQNAKDKVKNAPQNAKDRYNKAKDKWNNRPKNFNEAKSRAKDKAKNAGKNLKDKAKQAPKNLANKAKDKAKDKAKEKFGETKVGSAINKAQDIKGKVDATVNVVKKAFKAIQMIIKYKYPILIGLAVLVLIVAISVLMSIIFPGLFGDVKTDEYSNYANVDHEVLEKMKEEANKYPNADAALAMAVVVYPYFEQLHNGNVSNYLVHDTSADEEEAEVDVEDEEDIEKQEGDQEDDDMYLFPFRNKKVRKRYSKVLEALNKGDEEFKKYLKDDYFKNDKGYKKGYDEEVITGYNGYKKLFKAQIDENNRAGLEDEIIENLYEIKDMFLGYIFDKVICSSNSVAIGSVDTDASGKVSSHMIVRIMDTKSGKNSDLHSANILKELEWEDYVLGVTYQEIGFGYKASSQAQMIAAQSFVIGRTYPGGTGAGMGWTADVLEDGTIVYYVRNSTNDQAYCSVYEGCSEYKPKLSAEKLAEVESWYEEIAPYFIYHAAGNYFFASYVDNETTRSKNASTFPVGSVMLQQEALELAKNGADYETILFKYFTDGYTLYDSGTKSLASVTTNCVGTSIGGCAMNENDFKYHSQRSYPNVAFCGRTGAEEDIYHSGCGIVSMTMVLENLASEEDFNPGSEDPVKFVMQEAQDNKYCGYNDDGSTISGTKSAFLKHAYEKYKLTYYEEVPASDSEAETKVKAILNEGGLVIANVGAGWRKTVLVGHYLVIRGVTGDGMFYLADPMLEDVNAYKTDIKSFEEIVTYMDGRSFFLFKGPKSDEIKEKYCGVSATGDPGEVTGYLGNPLDPNALNVDYYALGIGNSKCYPTYCGGDAHGGVDLGYSAVNSKLGLVNPIGIYAMDGGIVSAVTDYSGNCYTGSTKCSCSGSSYGISVTVKHGDSGYYTHYAHMSQRMVGVGDTIAKGQQIGVMGNTGCSSGEHLHIELRSPQYKDSNREASKGHDDKGLMNPTKYINSTETYIGKEK